MNHQLSLGKVGCCLLSLAFFPVVLCAQGGAVEGPNPEIPITRLTLYPAAAPTPALRYELVPGFRDRIAGNAAISYHRAIMMLPPDPVMDREQAREKRRKIDELLTKPLKELQAETIRREIAEYIAPFRNAYREIEHGTKRDRCDWDLERRLDAEGIAVLLPEVQKMRELAYALKLRCRLHLVEGKIEDALKDVQLGFTMGRHVGEGPTLIQALVGIAIIHIFSAELELIVQQPGAPNMYWALSALPRPMVDLRKPLEGEVRSFDGTLPMLKEVEKGPMTVEQVQRIFDQWTMSWLELISQEHMPGAFRSKLVLATYITLQGPNARKSLLAMGKTEKELDAMPAAQIVVLDGLLRFKNMRDEAFVWFYLPYTEAREGIRRTEERLRKFRVDAEGDLLGMALMQMLPAVEKVFFATVRTDRRISALRTIEALRLHAAANQGKLPTQLSDVKEVPVPPDPVTGQPFKYSFKDGVATLFAPPPEGERSHGGNTLKYEITIGK